MNYKKIDELKAGEFIEGFFLIGEIENKITSNNKKYLDIKLIDQTGEIKAKLWDCTEDDESKYIKNILVKIRGLVTQWQNKLQIRIDRIRTVTPEDNLNIEEFVPVASVKAEFMYKELVEYILKIQNDDIRNIVNMVIQEIKPRLLIYPAAKQNHHAVRSGLLYHIVTMLKVGEALSEIYSFINKDLLYAGIILHDISKIDEMQATELGIVSEYTIEGQLLGHIVQGIKRIDRIADKIGADDEIVMLLQHMVLTHHYEPEFGSPKKPMIPEAELLHYIDMIDARMFDMGKALNKTEEGKLSDRVWSLDNRRLFKATINKKE